MPLRAGFGGHFHIHQCLSKTGFRNGSRREKAANPRGSEIDRTRGAGPESKTPDPARVDEGGDGRSLDARWLLGARSRVLSVGKDLQDQCPSGWNDGTVIGGEPLAVKFPEAMGRQGLREWPVGELSVSSKVEGADSRISQFEHQIRQPKVPTGHSIGAVTNESGLKRGSRAGCLPPADPRDPGATQQEQQRSEAPPGGRQPWHGHGAWSPIRNPCSIRISGTGSWAWTAVVRWARARCWSG